MSESFDVKKSGKSFVEFLPWWKSSMIGVKILIIALIGFTIYRAWFVDKNKQETDIVVEEGGVLHLKQIQGDNKKFQVFGEAYVFCESPQRYGVGVRTGVKF